MDKMFRYILGKRASFKCLLLIGTMALILFLKTEDHVDVEQDYQLQRNKSACKVVKNRVEVMESLNEEDLDDPLVHASLNANEDHVSVYDEELHEKIGVKFYGEYGKPVILPANLSKDIQPLVKSGWNIYGINVYVSDLVSVQRELLDPRDDWCKEPDRFLSDLPQTSIIIVIHNEAWSILLRTVHSILNRSPAHLLKEIILVDDSSYMPHLKTQLEEYMANYPKVQIIRTTKREGLIRARLLGVKHATAPVLTFFDAHCECSVGWLEPLLDRISRNSSTVVCPLIDNIEPSTLEYKIVNPKKMYMCGFRWLDLEFKYIPVSKQERERRSNQAEPVHSPMMVGCLFSIDKNFFERLGTFDPGFEIWGAENLELSLKTWMCGGTLEIVPCSHVGHNFRHRRYNKDDGAELFKRNSIRMAKVWMDDYAKYFFEYIGNDLGDYGNISSRVELRDKLECKSFKWYLDNVYPTCYDPATAIVRGNIANTRENICFDNSKARTRRPIDLTPCHNKGGHQHWYMSKNGEIRYDEYCIDHDRRLNTVIFYWCLGTENQKWSYKPNEKLIQLASTTKCLASSHDKKILILEDCDPKITRQQWMIANFPNASTVAA